MVQHPERVDGFDLGMRALLPVEPPKVDAFIFERVVQFLKVLGEEGFVSAFEWDRLGDLAMLNHEGR